MNIQELYRKKDMIKILFVCHGNICRSPMAEFLFRDMVQKRGMGDQFTIASAATSMEEIGSRPHRGTRAILAEHGIQTDGKVAIQLRRQDYAEYDYLIGMDSYNIRNMQRITGGDPEQKIHRLLDFTGEPGDIADPWYSGNFDQTYADVSKGCEALFQHIMEHM